MRQIGYAGPYFRDIAVLIFEAPFIYTGCPRKKNPYRFAPLKPPPLKTQILEELEKFILLIFKIRKRKKL